MDEKTVAELRERLSLARWALTNEDKINAILEVLDDLLYNLPVEYDE